jgi:hypothetical protein
MRKRQGKDGGKTRKRWVRDKEKMKIKQITNTQIYQYTNIPINGSRSAVCGTRCYEC